VTLEKLVCVFRTPLEPTLPAVDGVAGYAVVLPATDIASEHPEDVHGIASVWVEPGTVCAPNEWFPGSHVDTYRVREQVHIDYERDWPDGQVSPGLHRMVFLRRAPGLSRDEMATHWARHHAPLVPVHHPAFWEYGQNVVLDTSSGAPEVDGIAEMHFRSEQDMRERFYDSDESRRIIGEDVARFLDRGRGWRILGREHWVKTPRTRNGPGR
jgi:EthD domain